MESPITAQSLQERLKDVHAYGNRAADQAVQIGDSVFTVRSLPTGVANYIDALPDPGERRWQMIRFGLVGWENVRTREGTVIPFTTETAVVYAKGYDVVSRDCMDMIPMPLMEPLGMLIVEHSFLTQVEQDTTGFTLQPAPEDASEAAQVKEPK